MQANIITLSAGHIKKYGSGNKAFLSAYVKDVTFNFVDVHPLGISEDHQADRVHHGGEDKAILIASQKHHDRNSDLAPFSMGQNILIDTYDESDICIGDIYTIGDIMIEVTQPRQPCWKIGKIFSTETFRYMVKGGATGWYVRVLVDGVLNINDTMLLHKRVSNISIKELTDYLQKAPDDKNLINEILGLPFLADAYKETFKKGIK